MKVSQLGSLHPALALPTMPTCTGSLGQRQRERCRGSLWFSIKHIYFTFIEYTRTESTRIQHGALRWGSAGTREERRVRVKRTRTASQLVGKVLLEKKKKMYIFRVMLFMQFQASLGMCLQDSKTETGLGTSYTLRWKRSQESKRRENKDL